MSKCHGCVHYNPYQYDSSTGAQEPEFCAALDAIADRDMDAQMEAVYWTLQNILFQLSELNNCPLRRAKAVMQRSLLDLKQ